MSSPDFWAEITTSKPVEKPKAFNCTLKKFPNWAEHGFIMSLILAFSIQSQAYFCEFKFKASLLCIAVRSRTVLATKRNPVSKQQTTFQIDHYIKLTCFESDKGNHVQFAQGYFGKINNNKIILKV